jgi:hypothetical protein
LQDKLGHLQRDGYCVLERHFAPPLIDACREAFWPILIRYLELHHHEPNRGPQRHFLPMSFEPPCFAPKFFFDDDLLSIMGTLMGDRLNIDQWGCDVALQGSEHQGIHVDYRRPLFPELPDLSLPVYMLVVGFGLRAITLDDGPIEIAPGTHNMPRSQAQTAVESGEIQLQPVPLDIGDVLVRHPWALHRGSPNRTDTPRTLVQLRYVRDWYIDNSREIAELPPQVWSSLTSAQQRMMRFPAVEGAV